MQYNWDHFTHKSLLIILRNWEILVLPEAERCKHWRLSWTKQKFVKYMNDNKVFMPIAVKANQYNLELTMAKWQKVCGELDKLKESNDFLIKTLFRHKDLSLSKCEPYVVEQIFKSGLTCSICLDNLERNTIVVSRCGHHYCNECFDKIEECSLCKKDFLKDVEQCVKLELN